jgi:hypothetical protein
MKDITNDMKLVQLLFFIQNNAQVKSSKNISIAAQDTTLHEYFSHPSSVFCLFPHRSNNTKTGTANWWKNTNGNRRGWIKLCRQ